MSQVISADTHGGQNLFQDDSGEPLVFYIDPFDRPNESLEKKIIAYGGHITLDANFAGSFIHLSLRYHSRGRAVILPSFVEDSIAKGALQYLLGYTVHPSKRGYGEDGPEAKKHKASKTTTKFTPETDNYILEQVRMKPRFRTLHKFFEEISRHEALKNHTGNSVRSRYRAHLEHKLQYVYKTDEYDNLVLDADGQHIMVDASQAKTIKNKFTALDDYNLCNDIINHVISNPAMAPAQSQYLDEDKFSVSISFFDEYARNNPQHSSSSWRDRYRKFARAYGLQKYRDDYQKALETKEGPQPMRYMTRRAMSPEKKAALERKKAMKNSSALYSAAESLAHAHQGGFLGDDGHAMPHHSHLDQLHSQLDDNAAAAVANLAVAARAGHAALDEEIGEVKNSNIHEALRNVGAEAGRVDIEDEMVNAIHPNLTGGSDGDDYAIGFKEPDESQDLAKELEYLPADASMDDIFDAQFYGKDSKNILDKIVKFLADSGPEDVERVLETLVSFGFTRRFVGHVMRVTGANAMNINEYLSKMLRHVQDSKDPDVSAVIFIHNHDGFWTPEADNALITKNLEELSYMSEASLRHRRVFLGLEE